MPNYIDIAFQAAAAARGSNSSVKLFYNDYSAEPMNDKSDKVYHLVKGMKQRGIPIDGVGLQFHISVGNHPSLDGIAQNMARLGKLGLEVHITEMDLKCHGVERVDFLGRRRRYFTIAEVAYQQNLQSTHF